MKCENCKFNKKCGCEDFESAEHNEQILLEKIKVIQKEYPKEYQNMINDIKEVFCKISEILKSDYFQICLAKIIEHKSDFTDLYEEGENK